MEEGIASLVAQWGAFGVVLAGVASFAFLQWKEANKTRREMTEMANDHASAIQKMQKEHSETVVALQRERVEDAQKVTQTLLGLQGQFNETVQLVHEQLSSHTHAIEGVRASLAAIDRRVESLDRRV